MYSSEAFGAIGPAEAKEAAKPYERRKWVFDSFFHAMSIFVRMPWLALVVAAGIGVLGYSVARKKQEHDTRGEIAL